MLRHFRQHNQKSLAFIWYEWVKDRQIHWQSEWVNSMWNFNLENLTLVCISPLMILTLSTWRFEDFVCWVVERAQIRCLLLVLDCCSVVVLFFFLSILFSFSDFYCPLLLYVSVRLFRPTLMMGSKSCFYAHIQTTRLIYLCCRSKNGYHREIVHVMRLFCKINVTRVGLLTCFFFGNSTRSYLRCQFLFS